MKVPVVSGEVTVNEDYVIYRDCGIALTEQGKKKALSSEFIEFLLSPGGARIFSRWGWLTAEQE
jgi:accessory colonization factor AcfC